MTTPLNEDSPPDWLKPAAAALLIGTLALTGLVLALVLAGIADPHPLGTLTVDGQNIASMTAHAGHRLYQNSEYEVHCPCTMEITVRQVAGAPDAKYGLGWQAQDETPMIIGINGDGYYAAFDGDHYFVDWQHFPWIVFGSANRLRADIDAAGAVTYRINDEVAANFNWTGGQEILVGFFAEVTDGEATIEIERLRVWSEP